MTFHLDTCRVHAESGELLADGFVREQAGRGLVVEAEHFSGAWLSPGDPVLVQVLSSVRGECWYDAVVTASEPRRVEVDDLRLREAVQKRGAVRVPVSIVVPTTRVVVDGEALEEPPRVTVADVSATGMRLVAPTELPVGSLVELVLETEDLRLPVRLRVLRTVERGSATSHGCTLEGLSERDEDALFAYVLAEQRRQRAASLDRG